MGHLGRLYLDPTRVPTVPVEIDWGHPLAALNQHIVSFSQLRDYGAAPGAVVATAATIHGSSIGPGIATSGVAGSHISLPPRPQLIWNSGTVSVLFAALSNSSAVYATLVTKAPTSATREVGLFFNTSWASGLDYADWYGGNAAASSAGSVTLGQPTLFTITSAGDIYQGATLVETFSPANLSVSAASWYFGEDVNGASGAPANVNYLFFGAWTRVLTLAEIALLNAEPFGMLRPIMRRTWFVPASGGTSIILNIAALTGAPIGSAGAGQANNNTVASVARSFGSVLHAEALNAAAVAAGGYKPATALTLLANNPVAAHGALEGVEAAAAMSAGDAVTLLPVLGMLGTAINAGAVDAATARGVMQALTGALSGGGQVLTALGGIGAVRAALMLSAANSMSVVPVSGLADAALSLGAGDALVLAGRTGSLAGTLSGGGIGLVVLGAVGTLRGALVLSAAEALSVLATAGAASSIRGEAGNGLLLVARAAPAAGRLLGAGSNPAPILGRLGGSAAALSTAAGNGLILAPAMAPGIGALRVGAANTGTLDGLLAALQSAISAGADSVVIVGPIGSLSAILLLGTGTLNPAIVLTGHSVARIFGRPAVDHILGRSAVDRIFTGSPL